MFGQKGHKNGDTVRVRIPVRYKSALQTAINLNNTTETQTSITLVQRNIGVEFTSADMTLKMDLFSDRIIKPAMAQLASDIDQDGFATYWQGAGLVTPGAYTAGAPAAFTGVDVATLKPFSDAGAWLDINAAPRDGDRYVAVAPFAQAGIVDGLKSLFQSATEIADQYKRGLMGLAAGFEWVSTQTLPTFTCGTRVATGSTVNGSGNPVVGSTIVLGGTNAGTIVQGDQFTIAGVYAINPLTRVATNKLQIFTVQAGTSFTANAATVSVLPTISVTAPGETVSAAAADGAVVTFVGAASVKTDVNLAWHKDAMLVAFCELDSDLPGAKASMVRDPESGISVRYVEQYIIGTDILTKRFDCLYGWKCVRPSLMVRVQA
jgi:hypothetical protein